MPENLCSEPVTKWRLCTGPVGHEGDHANPWYPPNSTVPDDGSWMDEIIAELNSNQKDMLEEAHRHGGYYCLKGSTFHALIRRGLAEEAPARRGWMPPIRRLTDTGRAVARRLLGEPDA